MTDKSQTYNIVIAFHETLPCYVAERLKEYLLERYSVNLLFIGHPLLDNEESYKRTSRFEYFENSKHISKENAFHWVLPIPLLFVKNMIYTFVWCMKHKSKWDVFFGVDNISILVALFLKRIGKIKKVVYHPVDYFPIRFKNKLLNWLYFQFDKICVKFADETWNISEGMIEARQKKMGIRRDYKQYIFPICVWVNRVKKRPFNEINIKKIVYRGGLVGEMGVDLIIEAMPQIIKSIPKASLEIFGDGKARKFLEEAVRRLKIESYVKFHGWIRERKQLEELMSDGAVGVATFNTEIMDEKFKNADPGKIKDYMLMGMPVITTKAVRYYRQIENTNSGFIIDYKVNDLAISIIKLLSNDNLLKEYRNNALEFIKQFDCGKLFDENVTRVLN